MVSKLDQEIIFEVFEVSPRNKDVMTTRGRLSRSFPGSGVSIKLSLFELPDFQAAIASAVASMSLQAAPGTQPQAKKAKQMHEESRDTTHPMLVTEFLITIMAAHGGKPSNGTAINKHTREEVFPSYDATVAKITTLALHTCDAADYLRSLVSRLQEL